MARTIGPMAPSPVQPVKVDIPEFDLQIFDKIGDVKIKNATQNFQLYASTASNAEAQKVYQKFKNSPIALANALSKIPEMFSELPQSVQDHMKNQLDKTAISLVTRAQANQEKAIVKQNKLMAQANAALGTNQIADDYFNVLRYITSPNDEKRPIDMAVYQAHRDQLAKLVNLTDEDGKPLFSETQREKMLMPKDATVAGFKQFINRMEYDQLVDWDKNYFQDQTKFMDDTKIDSDTYESMSTALEKRLKALKDTKTRELHGQAYYDSMHLITEPTQLNIEKAKGYDFTDDKAIDKLVDAAKKTTVGAYYAPDKKTSPTAFLQTYLSVADLIQNIPDNMSEEEHSKLVAATADAMTQLSAIAKETNLDPEYTDRIKQTLQKALTDKQSRKALVDAGFANRVSPLNAFMEDVEVPEINQNLTPMQEAIAKTNKLLGIDRSKERRKQYSMSALYQSNINQLQKDAAKQYNDDLAIAALYHLAGEEDKFLQASAQADRNYDKKMASSIVKSESEWQRLEKALAEGKPAIVKYMGRTLEFRGFTNDGADFREIH